MRLLRNRLYRAAGLAAALAGLGISAFAARPQAQGGQQTTESASPGSLFGANKERGVYKTTDGGKTWNLVKYIDPDTGSTDIVLDPANSNIVYAASYQRRRQGCCFNGGGSGSAIWKSFDAGKTWSELSR